MIIAIDPGSDESAFTLIDDVLKPIEFGKVKNEELLERLIYFPRQHFAIEMVASYGMAVGKEVFDTVFWIGRFWEKAIFPNKQLIYRKDEKMNLCHSMRANDANITQALADRFAYGIPNKVKGTKKNPGPFFGFAGDVWQAYAVGVTYHDLYLKKKVAK